MKRTGAVLAGSFFLSVSAPARAQLTATLVRETQKILPSSPAPASSSAIALSCAQNEFCAFQVAVTAPAGGGEARGAAVASIVVSALSGPNGATIKKARVYREAFLDVTTPSNAGGATGLWPDPLIPDVDDFYGEARSAFPATIPGGQTQPFFVEVHVPDGQTPGAYAGTVTVTDSAGGTTRLTVNLQVRKFALPSTASLGSAYGFDWDGPCVGHFGGYGPPSCDDEQLEALNALYFQDALNHRLSISELVYAPPVANGQGDFTTFDTLYGPFLDGTVLGGDDQLQGAALTEIMYVGDPLAANYATWASHFQAKGWFARLFDYTCDEPPNGCAWNTIPTRAMQVHSGNASFRTLTTTSIQAAEEAGVLSSLDILVPIVNEMYGADADPYPGDQRPQYDGFLARPNTLLWMYQSCEPSSSCTNGTVGGRTGWPTMFVDEPAITNRIMQWMDFKYQVTTELYYDTTYAMAQASQDAWQTQYAFGNNGDGSIFYPGKPSLIGGTHDIPIESFRMKMLREGMQDYEYLHLLVTQGDAAFADAQLAAVVTNANDFTSDPGVLEQARLAMADEIEKNLAKGGASDAGAGDGAAPRVDGGSSRDAGRRQDAGEKLDARSPVGVKDAARDAASLPGNPGGGCGCVVGVAPAQRTWLGTVLLAAVGVLRRRRLVP